MRTRPHAPSHHALLALAACVCLLLPATPPVAAKNEGQDRALAERGRGSIVALEVLVRQAAALIPGRLLEAELEWDDDRLVYELQWLLPDGRRLEIDIDARNGAWLSLKGARLETVFRRP